MSSLWKTQRIAYPQCEGKKLKEKCPSLIQRITWLFLKEKNLYVIPLRMLKEDFVSNTSMGSQRRDLTPICPYTIQSMEVDIKSANRKRKTTEMEGNASPPKHVR